MSATGSATRQRAPVAARPPLSPGARWPLAAALAAPALLQIAVVLWAIWGDPVQVPWQDELFHYNFFMRARAGVATWAEFWQPIGGVHRTVFPRLLYVLAIDATAWDRRVWLTINPLLVAAACAALAATARRTAGGRVSWLALAPIAALLFALSQYSQWLQPFGLQFALVVCCAAVALLALAARPGSWPQLALAIGATWVASWSGLHGLALWVALLPLVALGGWRKALVWLACAAVVIASYAADLPHAGVQARDPATLLAYTLTNLGAPLGTLQDPARRLPFWNHSDIQLDGRPALALGAASALLLLVNLAATWRLRRDARDWLTRSLPWCCLAAFTVACAALTGVGRATAGTGSALTARYQTFALLWWVALLIVGWQATATARAVPRARRVGWRRALAALNLGALLVGAGLFAAVNVVSGLLLRDLHAELHRAERCARDLAASPDPCLTLLHPVPSVARLRLAGLAQERLALFRSGPPPTSDAATSPPPAVPDLAALRPLPFGGLYGLDGLPGALAYFDGSPAPPHFPATKPLQFSGWALDPSAVPVAPAAGVFLLIDGRPPVWVPVNGARPEIAARFDPALARCGFRLELPAGTLAPGRHTLRIAVVSDDGRAVSERSPMLTFYVD